MLSPPRRSVRFCVPKLSKLLRSRSWRGFNLSTVNVHRKSILKMTWRLKRSKWWCNLHLQLCLNFIILRTKMTRQPFRLIVFKLFWQFIITKSRKIYFQNIITQPLFTSQFEITSKLVTKMRHFWWFSNTVQQFLILLAIYYIRNTEWRECIWNM